MKIFLSVLISICTIITVDANPPERRSKRERKKDEQERLEQHIRKTTIDSMKNIYAAQTLDKLEKTEIESNAKADDARLYSIENEILKIDSKLTSTQLDSLVALWQEQRTIYTFDRFFEEYVDIKVDSIIRGTLPDSTYIERLADIVSPIQLPYNSIVRSYINRYTNPQYTLMSRLLGLSHYYFPYIESELIKRNMPVELRILPIIESALNSKIVSPAGATGLWQFMPATGKAYGLEINSIVDERCDPRKSTEAACEFLSDLYNMYDDWFLAIAAYNCGPGNVNKAMARSGKSGGNIWEIYDYLPRETRGYIPAFIAASYAYTYHQLHGIEATPSPMPIATDTLHINRITHLAQVSTTIDIPIETLRLLNPQYKIDIIPATKKAYALVLPQRNIVEFIEREKEIMSKDSLHLKEYINPANLDKKRALGTTTYYRVKNGDTLGAIAVKYRVSTSNIMRWNGIKNPDKLRLGQRIRIEGR